MFCANCGKALPAVASACVFCHSPTGNSPFAHPVLIVTPHHRTVYAILALLGGFCGAHNFYAGRLWMALIQLAISLGLAYLLFPVAVVWILAIVEIGAVSKDGSGVPMKWWR